MTTRLTRASLVPRALVALLLLCCGAAHLSGASVGVTTLNTDAQYLTSTTAAISFQRDSSSGPLTVTFSVSGTATLVPGIFTLSSSAVLTQLSPASSNTWTIVMNAGDLSENLVIAANATSLITGHLPLVVTISSGAYSITTGFSSAQVIIDESNATASVAVPAPVAYKDTAIIGSAADPNAPRRGILRASFTPQVAYPSGTQTIYVNSSSGPALASGAGVDFLSSTATGTLSAAFTTAPGLLSLSSPGTTAAILLGDRFVSSSQPTFVGMAGYDKTLAVQFSGTAPLPIGAAGLPSTSDVYSVSYKIGGSSMGSATNPTSNGVGYNVVAYPPGTTAISIAGVSQPITYSSSSPTTVYFAGNTALTATLTASFTGNAGVLMVSGLTASVHDGDEVQVVGNPNFNAVVAAPLLAGTTTFNIENGVGTLKRGDVFTLEGEPAPAPRYVVTSTSPAIGVNGSGQITIRRFTNGTIQVDGVNQTHSAATQTVPSPTLSTIFPVTGDIAQNMNLAATSGAFSLIVPAESTLVDFAVNPIDDGIVTGQLSVAMNLIASPDFASVSPTLGQLTIAESDSTASIQVSANAIQGATQSACIPGGFTISLSEPFPDAVLIPFTVGGQAIPGTDYQLAASTLVTTSSGYAVTLAPGATQVAVQVITGPPALVSLGTGKTLAVTLSPTYNYLLADTNGTVNASAVLSILPSPPPTPSISIALGTTAVQPTSASAPGTATTGTFIVTSATQVQGDLAVTYVLSGTAPIGADYVKPPGYAISSGLAVIRAGTSSVTIPINPAVSPLPAYNAAETVIATLPTVAGANYVLGTPTQATMTITQSQIGITGVTSTSSGPHYVGDAIPIQVVFSSAVTVNASTPAPTLLLNTGPTSPGIATYTSTSTDGLTLTFTYIVRFGDLTAALDYTTVNALLDPSGDIVDASTHGWSVQLALPTVPSASSLSGSTTIVLDGRPVISIVATAQPVQTPVNNGTFTIASSVALPSLVSLTVPYTFSGSAASGTDFTPTPAGSVVLDSTHQSQLVTIVPRLTAYKSPDQLIATLTPNALYRFGAASTTTATMTIAQSVIGVTSVTSSNANATYTINDQISLTVTFSAPVTVTGSPTLALNTGPTNAIAQYVPGSSSTTSTLNFLYVVGVNDQSSALDCLNSGALTGTFTDPNGVLTVQSTLPTPGAAGSLSASSTLVIDGAPQVNFNVAAHTQPAEPGTPGAFVVTCTPTPVIPVVVTYSLGGTAVIGTDIASPPSFSAGVGQVTIAANTSSITIPITPLANPVPNPNETVVATLTSASGYHLGTTSTDTLTVIQDVIGVVAVSSLDASGTYTYGQTVTVTVTFTQAVLVSGTPQLALAANSPPPEAIYSSGSGSATLNFTYVVGVNDSSSDLDCVGTTSLTTNGGTITSAGGQSVVLTLPTPGGPNSLGANRTLVIDGTLPAGKPTPGAITGPSAGSGGGCGLGSGFAALSALLAWGLRLSLRRSYRRRS